MHDRPREGSRTFSAAATGGRGEHCVGLGRVAWQGPDCGRIRSDQIRTTLPLGLRCRGAGYRVMPVTGIGCQRPDPKNQGVNRPRPRTAGPISSPSDRSQVKISRLEPLSQPDIENIDRVRRKRPRSCRAMIDSRGSMIRSPPEDHAGAGADLSRSTHTSSVLPS